MRYHELAERRDTLSSSKAYDYNLVSLTKQTHEFEDENGEGYGYRYPSPIEMTKYSFLSDNGLHYIVHCNLQDHVLDTSFTVMGGTPQGGRIGLNGAGDAFRVLATVVKIVSTFCRSDPPRKITFTALQSEPSRVKLYDYMCNHSEQFFPGYTLEDRSTFGRNIKYKLSRPLTPADHETDKKDVQRLAAEKARREAEHHENLKQIAARRAEKAERAQTATRGQRSSFIDDLFNSEDEETLRLLGLL